MIKRNNPGNIRPNPAYRWRGETTPVGASFCHFKSLEYGCRAMLRLLSNYRKLYSVKTVQGIISRWAPPAENNTAAYTQYVARRLGVAPGDAISGDSDTLIRLAMAMTRMEHGQEVERETWEAAYKLL